MLKQFLVGSVFCLASACTLLEVDANTDNGVITDLEACTQLMFGSGKLFAECLDTQLVDNARAKAEQMCNDYGCDNSAETTSSAQVAECVDSMVLDTACVDIVSLDVTCDFPLASCDFGEVEDTSELSSDTE
jgi:hypothetical protein